MRKTLRFVAALRLPGISAVRPLRFLPAIVLLADVSLRANEAEITDLDFTTRTAFDALDQHLNDGEGYKHEVTDGSLLAWGQSYVMHSYLLMYQAHRTPGYLDRLIDHSDHVLSLRDNERGIEDWRGLSLPAWSSTRDDETLIGLVVTGMATYPMIAFARVVYETPELKADKRYRQKADEYISAVREAVAVHDTEWEDGDEGDGGYRTFHGYPSPWDGIEYPHNQNLRMAMVMLHLHALTGDDSYLEKVLKMGKRWKDDLKVDENDAYIWHYHWTKSWGFRGWAPEDGVSKNAPSFEGNPRIEDVSHAHICIEFAELAHRHGLLFHDEDMRRFARTLTESALVRDADGNRTVTWRIDGTGDQGQLRAEVVLGMWMPLAAWDEEVFETIHEVFRRHGILGSRTHGQMMGTAYMNRYVTRAPLEPDAAFPPVSRDSRSER